MGSARPRDRGLRRSAEWFSEGTARKTAARLNRSCVECATPLASRRTPYCSRRCRWKFQGRYFWDSARTFVLHRDKFRCRACGERRRVRELEVDHIVEIALGGPGLDYANLQTLCRGCHATKTRTFLRRPRSARATLARAEADGFDWFPA
jgi:5-methylcytosine-specific restriction endonuclease McrA